MNLLFLLLNFIALLLIFNFINKNQIKQNITASIIITLIYLIFNDKNQKINEINLINKDIVTNIDKYNDINNVFHYYLFIAEYNKKTYVKAINHCNNFLEIYHDIIDKNIYYKKHMYDIAIEQYKYTINALMSLYVSVPDIIVIEDNKRNTLHSYINDLVNKVNRILQTYIYNLSKVIKVNIDSPKANDTRSFNYMANYNII